MVGLDRHNHSHYVHVDRQVSSSKEVLHMLFHILGRYHEHERADSKKYIDIIRKNIIEGTFMHIMHLFRCICMNEKVMKKFLSKTGLLALPRKGQKQGVDLQPNALTFLVHFALQLHKLD